MKLNVKAFSITFGLIWGIGIFGATWWIMAFDGAGENALSAIYRGYEISAVGSLIGLAYGLADGFVGGVIFAWLYNYLVGKFTR